MNYEEIFHERGGAYHRAMHRWPLARRDDFLLPLSWAGIEPGERVLDVPAGGGYLRRHLPDGCSWFGHEPCASFLDGETAFDQSLLPLPFADHFADVAISIAGVHHLHDKRPLFAELHRVLGPTGRLVLADAHVDSGVAGFLDEFVGRYNSTGHEGIYLGLPTLAHLEEVGFTVVRAERVRYAWWFSDQTEMAAFCRSLFDMSDVTDEEIAAAVDHHLGMRSHRGEVGMNWELYFIKATKDAGSPR